MHKIMPDFYDSPNFECGTDRDTIEHYLLECPTYKIARHVLITDLETIFLKLTKIPKIEFSLQTILGKLNNVSWEVTSRLRLAAADFIQSTAADI